MTNDYEAGWTSLIIHFFLKRDVALLVVKDDDFLNFGFLLQVIEKLRLLTRYRRLE